jgi:hypothetical protein
MAEFLRAFERWWSDLKQNCSCPVMSCEIVRQTDDFVVAHLHPSDIPSSFPKPGNVHEEIARRGSVWIDGEQHFAAGEVPAEFYHSTNLPAAFNMLSIGLLAATELGLAPCQPEGVFSYQLQCESFKSCYYEGAQVVFKSAGILLSQRLSRTLETIPAGCIGKCQRSLSTRIGSQGAEFIHHSSNIQITSIIFDLPALVEYFSSIKHKGYSPLTPIRFGEKQPSISAMSWHGGSGGGGGGGGGHGWKGNQDKPDWKGNQDWKGKQDKPDWKNDQDWKKPRLALGDNQPNNQPNNDASIALQVALSTAAAVDRLTAEVWFYILLFNLK